MDQRLFRIATKVATPISLASLSVIALYLIYQSVVGLHIFGDLTGDQTSQLINNIANKIFYLAVLLSVLGISSYLYTKGLTVPSQRTGPHAITGNVLTESGLPVTGAVVFVEGVDRRRITDENGWFQIQVEHRALLIVRAYLGDRMARAEVKRSKLGEPVTLILPPPLGSLEPLQPDLPPDSKQQPTSSDSKEQPTSNSKETLYCSFCGKSQHQVRKLIVSDFKSDKKVLICDECTDLCVDIIDDPDLVKQAKHINELCETTLKLVNPALTTEERVKLRDQADQLSAELRSRRRERPGDLAAGFILTRVIGNGNFSTVWEAHDSAGLKAAVKIFDQNKLAQGLMLWRFLRGIRAMQHLCKQRELVPKSIVRILSTEECLLAFSMQYLPGGDLERIRQLGWSMTKKLVIFRQVADAVQFAHHHGIVHRDIKPANVVLDEESNAVLTDFDIADLHFAATQSVMAGSLGTPQFAAPEQLMGETLQAFPTADIYSLGKLLYFLVTEAPPPLGSTDPDRVPSYLEAISDGGIRDVIHRAINYRPEDRFRTVSEMIQAVQVLVV